MHLRFLMPKIVNFYPLNFLRSFGEDLSYPNISSLSSRFKSKSTSSKDKIISKNQSTSPMILKSIVSKEDNFAQKSPVHNLTIQRKIMNTLFTLDL